jgi:TolA-binding protein
MNSRFRPFRPVRAVTSSALATVLIMGALVGSAGPAFAQDTLAEARLRRIEAEVRALQRQVFPGPDGKVFKPEITPSAPANGTPAPGQPATTPLTDLLSRMESVEAQIARLTSQSEQNANRLGQIETRLGIGVAPAVAGAPAEAAGGPVPLVPSAAAPTPAVSTPAPAPQTNLNAMTGGASAPRPTATVPAAAAPRPATAAVSGPSAQRIAAVRAIEKPQTTDAGDDEYSYGFRLWEARFFPEAQQQLKLYVDKYPRHSRISYGRNLLGRAFLDDGKPREAATWFLQNFQADKTGARAADSLLYLAVSMAELKDTNRACIALAEFGETYAAESVSRLKTVYDATRARVKCN